MPVARRYFRAVEFTQMADQLFLTVKDVAQRLQLSEKTVRRLIDAGELPFNRIRSAIRIAEEDLNQFLKLTRS